MQGVCGFCWSRNLTYCGDYLSDNQVEYPFKCEV